MDTAGVPEFYAVPYKVSKSEVDFAASIGTFIADELNQDPAEYRDAVQQITALRTSVAGTDGSPPGASEANILLIQKYIGCFNSMRQRIPINAGEKWTGVIPEGGMPIQFNYTWVDNYPPSGMFSKAETTSVNSNFEELTMIFNLGAMQSQFAKNQTCRDDASIKLAATNFQAAANTFARLDALVQAKISPSPSPDLDSNTLTCLSKLMAAQAQEALWLKVVNGKMKPPLIAKVSMAASIDFDNVTKIVSSHAGLSKMVGKAVGAKNHFFEAQAQYWQGIADGDDNMKYGTRVARYTKAKAALDLAAPNLAMAKAKQATMKQLLTTATKDNNEIYNDRVPSFDSVDAVVPQSLIKLNLPLPDFDSEAVRGVDLFAKLLPISVQRDVDTYKKKLTERVTSMVEKLKTVNQTTITKLAEWNLPSALEVVQNPAAFPQSLRDNSGRVQSSGGVQPLKDMMQAMPGLRDEVSTLVEDGLSMLEREETEDEKLRSTHGSKWTRKPSSEINASTKAEGKKLAAILVNAANSDAKVTEKFEENRDGITALGQGESQLQQLLPDVVNRSPSQASGLNDLKGLLESLEGCRGERETLERELLSVKESDDITPVLLARGSVDINSLADQQLTRYTPFETKIDVLVTDATERLNATSLANEAFVRSQGSSGGTDQRQTVMGELQKNFDAFLELQSNLSEGTKFYGQLLKLAKNFQTKVKDFTYARKEEKASLLSDINQSIADTPSDTYGQNPVAPLPTITPYQPPTNPYQPPATYNQPPPAATGQYGGYNQGQGQGQYGGAQPPGYQQYNQQQQQQQQQQPYGGQPAYGGYQQPPPQSYQPRSAVEKEQAAQSAFGMFDGGTGFVDQQGFFSAMQYLGAALSWDDSNAIFAIYDDRGSGRISREQFVANFAGR